MKNKIIVAALAVLAIAAVVYFLLPAKRPTPQVTPPVSTPVATQPTPAQPVTPATDERRIFLAAFFDSKKCPQPTYVSEYIEAADKYGLDYRLLPAISIEESSCGQHQLYNNFWGFWSDTKGFPDVATGIDFVSNQLANSSYYKGKTLEQKLMTYNSINPNYANTIKALMSQIEKTK